jgi:phosphoenolpyruvate synthase/pyruvate phosphate dikinase
VEAAAEAIWECFRNAVIPEAIKNDILTAFNELDCEFVAVRSSATSEDSAGAAWAGLLNSFLNTTEQTLLENVKKCWASLFTAGAIVYRHEQNLTNVPISVAVVIQKMVDSAASGIAFSVHPLRQDDNQLIIEAAYGLGEAVVSGRITPDSYVVDKRRWSIIDSRVGKQSGKFIRSEKGGNTWVDLTDEQGRRQVLSEEEIIALARLIVRIEEHCGFPCDIEWAQENHSFYIVQSRAITTLPQDFGKISKTRPNQTGATQTHDVVMSDFYVIKRDFCLGTVQLTCWAESTDPKQWTELKQPFLPYCVCERKNQLVHFFFDLRGVKWIKDALETSVARNINFPHEVTTTLTNRIQPIKAILDEEPALSLLDLQTFIAQIRDAWVWFEALWWLIDLFEEQQRNVAIDQLVRDARIDQLLKVRRETDNFVPGTDAIIRKSLQAAFPDYGQYVDVISLEEAFNQALPAKNELQQRLEYYLYTNSSFYQNRQAVEAQYRYRLEDEKHHDEITELSGQVACKGMVQGRITLVFGRKDLHKMREGDIIVSPSVTPDFMPALHKSKAIITNEGGIISHAAIISRELQKPCIIGTQIAAHVLHDGDLVEVDAYNGVVRVLERV